VKPLKVEIVSPNDILSTGRIAFVKCETWGSHPVAKIQWFLDGETIKQADITTNTDMSSSSNMTASTLSFKVLPEYDGKELTCKAMNPWFLNGAIEDNRRISVSCKYKHICTSSYTLLSSLLLSSFLSQHHLFSLLHTPQTSAHLHLSFSSPYPYPLSSFFIDFGDMKYIKNERTRAS
jgi:hypothetical protein